MPSNIQRLLLTVLRGHSLWCLGDFMRCQGSSRVGHMQGKRVLPALFISPAHKPCVKKDPQAGSLSPVLPSSFLVLAHLLRVMNNRNINLDTHPGSVPLRMIPLPSARRVESPKKLIFFVCVVISFAWGHSYY